MSDATPSPTSSGWKTTEWWSLMASKLIAVLGLLGIFTSGETASLQDATAKAIAAAGIVVAQVCLVLGYFRHRRQVALPVQTPAAPAEASAPKLPLVLLALLCGGLLCGPALGGDTAPGVSTFAPAKPTVQPTGVQIGLLNCCPGGRGQQQAPAAPQQAGPDPTTISMLQQVLGNQQLILSQLAALARQVPPASGPALVPAPAPQILIVPQGQQAPAQPYYQPQPLPQGYAPNPLPQGYAPNPLPPGYAPNPLPQGYQPQPLPQGYTPQPITPPGYAPQQQGAPAPGYNPQPLPPAPQPQRYTQIPTERRG